MYLNTSWGDLFLSLASFTAKFTLALEMGKILLRHVHFWGVKMGDFDLCCRLLIRMANHVFVSHRARLHFEAARGGSRRRAPFFPTNVFFYFPCCGVIRERARSVTADLHPLSVSSHPTAGDGHDPASMALHALLYPPSLWASAKHSPLQHFHYHYHPKALPWPPWSIKAAQMAAKQEDWSPLQIRLIRTACGVSPERCLFMVGFDI